MLRWKQLFSETVLELHFIRSLPRSSSEVLTGRLPVIIFVNEGRTLTLLSAEKIHPGGFQDFSPWDAWLPLDPMTDVRVDGWVLSWYLACPFWTPCPWEGASERLIWHPECNYKLLRTWFMANGTLLPQGRQLGAVMTSGSLPPSQLSVWCNP